MTKEERRKGQSPEIRQAWSDMAEHIWYIPKGAGWSYWERWEGLDNHGREMRVARRRRSWTVLWDDGSTGWVRVVCEKVNGGPMRAIELSIGPRRGGSRQTIQQTVPPKTDASGR